MSQGEAVTEKINGLQVDLDHEVAIQSSREKKLELLRSESRDRESLQAWLSGIWGKLEKKSSGCRRETLSCNRKR